MAIEKAFVFCLLYSDQNIDKNKWLQNCGSWKSDNKIL